MGQEDRKLEAARVLLGISGGVAAYKAVELASKMAAGGATVRTVMTENACRLVGPKSLEAVTRQAVYTSLWEPAKDAAAGHVALADWAEVVVLAPATADIIGKVANGICDDLLSTTLCCCWSKPMVIAPAMNNRMWENPAVQANVEKLRGMGFVLVGPEVGRLACGGEAVGRMAEPEKILEAVGEQVRQVRQSRQ